MLSFRCSWLPSAHCSFPSTGSARSTSASSSPRALMGLRTRQRHPVPRAVDHSEKGWGSMPEVLLQSIHPTVQWEQGREPTSSLQTAEGSQEEPHQEETLDLKTATRQTPPYKLLEKGTLRQNLCMSSKQAMVLPSANHPLGAVGHPAPSPPSTQAFTISMSSPACWVHP